MRKMCPICESFYDDRGTHICNPAKEVEPTFIDKVKGKR